MATNCPRCGKIFTKVSSPICKECEKAEIDKFDEVRLYVKENPNSSAQDVAEACEVTIKRLLHWVREGKLDISEGMADLNLCSKCGRPIKSGRLCDRCAKNTANAIAGMVAVGAAASEAKKVGMFTSK
jgi:ribosomal protein L32